MPVKTSKQVQESSRRRIAESLTKVVNVRFLKKLFGLIQIEYKAYRWHIVLLGILSFFAGILEGFGITAIIPIFSFVNKGKAETGDLISQIIEKFFNIFHLPYTLKFLLIFILVIFITKSILTFLANHISASITTRYEKQTRAELLDSTLSSNWQNLSKQKVGYLSQILTTDISNSSALLTYIGMFLITAINLIVYTFLAFNVSPTIALITVVFGILVFFIFKPLLYKNKALAQEASQLYKETAHYVDEVVIGAKAIKASSLESAVHKRGHMYFDRLRFLLLRAAVLKNLANALLQPMGIMLILSIFAYFYKFSSFNFASFAVIVYAINKVFANVEMGQAQLHKISSCIPFLAAVVEYKELGRQQSEINQGNDSFSFVDRLEFKGVHFAYTPSQKILKDINFSVKKGSIVGIIGPSGSGKTTITDLILRLFDPTQGNIYIDGKTIETFKLDELRKNIGYVSQDSFLVNDTVENNIKFYNETISHEAVIRAAKMAHVSEFINKLPEKYDTVVGERGVQLSGGQRQRIILARVLVNQPQVLILDEATSALDNESEAIIQETITELKGTITVIMIAHRLSTVLNADNLLVIEKGKIIEEGSPEQLLKDSESYLSRVYNLR